MSEGASERRDVPRRSLLAALVGLGLSVFGCAGGAGPRAADSPGVSHGLVGASAPEFELRDVSGAGDQSLAAHAGKVVVVDFWATWCQPCKQSFPAYQKLLEQMNGQMVVLAVSQDDDAQGIAAFVADTGAKFPVLWDEGKAVAKSYDPPTMPSAFVVDPSGIIRFVHAGYRAGDEATLEREVRSLLR
jgi:peroxiredoxin